MFKKITIGMLLSVLIIGQFSMVSEATDSYETSAVYYVNYARPAVTDECGYINILLSDGTMNTYFWSMMATNDSDNYIPMKVRFDLYENSFSMLGYGHASAINTANIHLYSINKYGLFFLVHEGSLGSLSTTRNFGNKIVGWQVYGNAIVFDNVGCTRRFEVHYAEDGSAELLMKVVNLLGTNNIANNGIIDTVHGILATAESVDNQLFSVIEYLKSVDSELDIISDELRDIYVRVDEILEEQKKTNTWLEKIFNYLNESAEEQKQEAQTQGNNSTSQGMNAIEDKGAGFTDSLGGLAGSMSYTGTQCAWNMPQIKLPAISGVMDEVVLLESQPIDFSQWVSIIPANIMLVIQSVLTIGLIVYCFKELYSTIAYVLTLRKDDNS